MKEELSSVYILFWMWRRKWYHYWLENGLFSRRQLIIQKSLSTILLPPPNITGSLHLGHALNATIQDILN